MTRMLVVVSVRLCLALGVLAAVARSVGTWAPGHPAFVSLTAECGNRAAPCWRGIQVGQTSISEARDIVLRAGYSPVMEGYDLSDRVFPYRSGTGVPGCVDLLYGHQTIQTTVVILRCMNVVGGDVLLALGQPKYRVAYGRGGEEWVFSHVIVRLEDRWAASLFVQVQHIRIVVDDRQYSLIGSAWKGLLPKWRYCQLEPDYAACLA